MMPVKRERSTWRKKKKMGFLFFLLVFGIQKKNFFVAYGIGQKGISRFGLHLGWRVCGVIAGSICDISRFRVVQHQPNYEILDARSEAISHIAYESSWSVKKKCI
jgi:hypothetical protein